MCVYIHIVCWLCWCIVVGSVCIGTFVWIVRTWNFLFPLLVLHPVPPSLCPFISFSLNFFSQMLELCLTFSTIILQINVCVCVYIWTSHTTQFLYHIAFLLSVWWYYHASFMRAHCALSNCNRELIYAEIVIIINFRRWKKQQQQPKRKKRILCNNFVRCFVLWWHQNGEKVIFNDLD